MCPAENSMTAACAPTSSICNGDGDDLPQAVGADPVRVRWYTWNRRVTANPARR
jgi:hypothetical protein